ncbi:hypothetical protein BP6252_04996 [Coleophoma cylindrospora]|uniref:Acetyl-CoA synthetase-like protein n=1 Tax=Coleophoma cylindrospora TaxID=1849047 RepID=A0A3D8RSA4_9HELO|nr:hypothetical protein BP6252_04996 [Coleophoma cylindrospora]
MPAKSPYPDINVPEVDIWAFLFDKQYEFPETKTIYTDPLARRSYTFADVKRLTAEFGAGLRTAWDWKKDDVLLIYSPNSIDTAVVMWGTHWAGGILTPANPGYTVHELAFQLKDSGAKAIATQKEFIDQACEAAKLVGIAPDRIILIGNQGEKSQFSHFTEICKLGKRQGERLLKCTISNPKHDLAFLVYSSGTTGSPKGVMLSHTNIISNLLMLKASEGVNMSWKGRHYDGGDRILGFLPFYHIYGLTSLVHQSLINGLELVVMSKFDLENFCRHIQHYKITMAYVVPPVLLQLAKSGIVDRFDLSSLRMMSSGAAPLSRELVDAVYKRLRVPIKQAYGLSETSPTTHSQPWDTWDKYIGSVGPLLANQIVKYMSPEEVELPLGTAGEIWIKGPNIFQGYLNNPQGTQNALTSDGYFKTGDIGYQDETGNLYITDRMKELIKYKGFQVPPAELEGHLLTHHDVEDVAVVGFYRKEMATEVPVAFVVLRNGIDGTPAKEKEIVQWLSSMVASHKRLRGGIRWAKKIPKSPSGKILRRVLRKEMEELSRAKL